MHVLCEGKCEYLPNALDFQVSQNIGTSNPFHHYLEHTFLGVEPLPDSHNTTFIQIASRFEFTQITH